MAEENIVNRMSRLLTASTPKLKARGGKEISHPPFSVFIPEHLDAAMELVEEFNEIADEKKGEAGINAVFDRFEAKGGQHNPRMLEHALKLFLTHHPAGRALSDKIPTLEESHPHLIKSSVVDTVGGVLPRPDGLEWFREDPEANYHHEHWHVVYPTRPPKGKRLNDRHGELFFYMHRQMLARYDTERLTMAKIWEKEWAEDTKGKSNNEIRAAIENGEIPAKRNNRVKAFDNYDNGIPEGYAPNLAGFNTRDFGAILMDLTREQMPGGYLVTGHRERHKRLMDAISSGSYNTGQAVDIDNLGDTIESNMGTASRDENGNPTRSYKSYYGNFHGFGHVLAALIPTADPDKNKVGVMYDPATAIRDPFFFRWHKHVDDVGSAFQATLPPHKFTDRPYVKVRKHFVEEQKEFRTNDFFLCFEDAANPDKRYNFDYQKYGEETFGGSNWNMDRSEFGTTELITSFEKKAIKDDKGKVLHQIDHLVHKEFLYVLKIENEMPIHQTVTVRIFLCPTEVSEDRKMWIELDKFVKELSPKEKAVVTRKANKSTVVKKPALMRPTERPLLGMENPFHPDGTIRQEYLDELNYCTCGWPYHLLIPKGTEAGMPFRLVAVITDWQVDRVGPGGKCENMSYCGAVDTYPDSRPMGYPFDRSLSLSIKDTILTNKNFVAKDITIKHIPTHEA